MNWTTRSLAVLCAAFAAGCDKPATSRASATAEQPAEPAAVAQTCVGASDIVLRGQLHGALTDEVIARLSNTECRGMPRPAAQGLRLHFRTTGNDRGTPLTMILGIDDIGRGDAGDALRTTVTLIDEDGEQFFSTGQQDNCFSDVKRHEQTTEQLSTVEGVLWCTAAVPQINGPDSVRITDLYFSGIVTWPAEG
ncbi:MAG: hypothetical protein AAFO81_00240 [Pseudomonadota bacterium]